MAKTNKELFEQAIAEAKYVREAAISNAKESLEESMTPYLKDLLAAKLQEIEELEEEEEVLEEGEKAKKEDTSEAEDKEDDKEEEDDSEKSDDDSEEVEGEEDMEDMPDLEDMEGGEEGGEEDSLEDMDVSDLRELIRDLIQQEMGDMGPAEDDIDLDSEPMPADDMESDMVGRDDEDISLEELLKELDLSEEEDSEEIYENKEQLRKELEEAMATIESMRSELSEINLLNTKLLYLNKAFNKHNLSEDQKADLISTFDKAETKKEVELVYETFSASVRKQKEQIKESKGYASKPVGQAAKKEIISEVDESVRRMQKLAGII